MSKPTSKITCFYQASIKGEPVEPRQKSLHVFQTTERSEPLDKTTLSNVADECIRLAVNMFKQPDSNAVIELVAVGRTATSRRYALPGGLWSKIHTTNCSESCIFKGTVEELKLYVGQN